MFFQGVLKKQKDGTIGHTIVPKYPNKKDVKT